MTLALREFQKEGVRFAAKRRACIIGDDPGLGKTIEAITLFRLVSKQNQNARCLVICPAHLKLNWAYEFKAWMPGVFTEVVSGKNLQGQSRVTIMNYDILLHHHSWIREQEWELLIVDEAHYLKNPKTQRTKLVLGGRIKGKRGKNSRKGFVVKAVQARRRLFLTGTPMLNRPIELWPLIRTIDPSGWGSSFMKYALRFCDPRPGPFGWDYSGASHLDELHTYLQTIMIRRRKADVLTELPMKTRQTLIVESSKAGKLLQREFEVYNTARLLGGQSRFQVLGELSKIRRELALLKIPHAIEIINDVIADEPLVVFAWHLDIIDKLVSYYKDRCAVISGKVSMNNRDQAVRDFQSGKKPLFIGQILSAGTGLTLTRASRVLFLELDMVPGNMIQAEDRVHRIGQQDAVLIQHLILKGSLDHRIVSKLIKKQTVIETAVDGKVSASIITRKSKG